MRWPRVSAVLLTLLASCAASPAGAREPDQASAALPGPDSAAHERPHVAVVVMENHSQAAILGTPGAPYITELARTYTSLDHYAAVAHPSLPNYLALIGGDTFGITSDCTRCWVAAPNLSDLLAAGGLSGKAYMEDMPGPCFSGSRGAYAQKHNPFIYFDDIRTDAARCQSVVPYSQLAVDLAAGQLPDFSWITPNLCHDMHDCGVETGDRWLAANLPQLLESPAFSAPGSWLAVVWDEDDGSAANQVPLVLAGPAVKRGYVSHQAANHYSLLRTIESVWHLPSLTDNDRLAQPIGDAFQLPL